MNINWGLLPEPDLPSTGKKRDKGMVRSAKLEAARKDFASWLEAIGA
jgi:hypothetical protein